MTEEIFDLVVIGAGPGGYTGAIRASQLGLKVAVIEKEASLGGTCLNVGCIPSKALLDSSEHYLAATKDLAQHGVQVGSVSLDLNTMMARKDQIVSDLTGGIAYLLKKNKITLIHGHGQLKTPNEVEVITNDGNSMIRAKNILLATGSAPNKLPFVPFDGQIIVSSTEALCFKTVPNHLVVVGGGVIGLELGSVWKRLGSHVTLIEYTNTICGGMDLKMSKSLQQILKKQGIEFILPAKVTGVEVTQSGAQVKYELLKDQSPHSLAADKVLVATGRKPFVEGLGLEKLGIKKDSRKGVQVDSQFRTNIPNIYAIGDLIKGPMLAHKAEEEGVAVAETLADHRGHVNYEALPGVIYTWPEFASVGKTEEQLQQEGVEYKTGSFPFRANGRAKAMASTEGLVKILAHATTDKVLGVHILGPRASDMIAEAVVAMEFSASSEDIARSFHAHPTLAEVIREAALAVDNRTRQM